MAIWIPGQRKLDTYASCRLINVSQKLFFEWFYKNITCPTIKNIRQRYNPSTTPLSEDDPIPADQKFVLWGDSDIPYLKEMMSPSRIAEALLIGLCFGKIGAKITEDTQPMDLGPFFKLSIIMAKL